MVLPDEAGIGHAPQSFAKAASERIRSGLSPKMRSISAAVRAFTAVSGATLSWRIISTAPSAVLGTVGYVALDELTPANFEVKWVTAVDEEAGPSLGPEERRHNMRQAVALNAAESNTVTSPDELTAAAPADEVDQLAAVAAFRAVVTQAQQEAEAQLSALVERVRQATAEQHAL